MESKFKVHEGEAEILFGGLPYCDTLAEHFNSLPKDELVNNLCTSYSSLFQGNLDWFTGGLDRVLQTRELPDDVCGRLAVERTYLDSKVVGYSKGTQFKPHEGEAEELFGHMPYFEPLGEHFNSLPKEELVNELCTMYSQVFQGDIEKYKGGMDYILQTRIFPDDVCGRLAVERTYFESGVTMEDDGPDM